MSASEKDRKVEERQRYTSPEVVVLGDVRELTAGNEDGVVSDGGMKPKGYKDV
jgi:hypothetical protein